MRKAVVSVVGVRQGGGVRARALTLGLTLLAAACAERGPGAEPTGPLPEPTPAPAPAPAGESEPTAPPAEAPAPSPSAVTDPELVQHTVKVDGHPMAVWMRRPESPRGVILLVHGRTWSSRPDFDLQVPGDEERSLMTALARAGWAAYAVDLRGYGSTPRDDTGWNTPDRAAKDLDGVLAWIIDQEPEHSKVALFGWSLGSMVSQLATQRAPDKVSMLVLFGYPRHPDRKRSPEKPDGPPPRNKTTAAQARSDFLTPTITDAAAQAFVDACLEHDPVRTDWTRGHEWNELKPEQVKVPTLLIHGEHDPLVSMSSHAAVFKRLGHPDRAWVVVPRGDHAAHLEDTHDAFVAALLGFLSTPRP